MVKFKRLSPEATLPTIGHPGEDIGYDLYASAPAVIPSRCMRTVKTDIAAEKTGFGFLIKERSSLGKKQLQILGGVIDAGYRGELVLMLQNYGDGEFIIKTGDKLANLIPIRVATCDAIVDAGDEELAPSARGTSGFGSTGK